MKQETLQLTGANYRKDRRELDFYPTPKEVTIALMNFLDLPASVIWEPACGDGAMSVVLEDYLHNVISTDIRETGYGIGGVDFLSAYTVDCDAIITNPPFNEAERFIEKAIQTAPLVAMLLKSQYWHAKKRYAFFKKHPPTYVLPLTWRPDFLNNEKGGKPTMECLWTVWKRGGIDPTIYEPLLKPAM